MKLLVFLLAFFGNLLLRGGSLASSLVVAIFMVILVSLVVRAARRQAQKVPRPGRRRAPAIVDGDIGPYVTYMLERGDREAVAACLVQHIPSRWEARQGILMLAEEHCRLQRSIRIAILAGVPMPDETAEFSARQTSLIADRARRMAFINQHGLMNPRIDASLTRLARGAGSLAAQSTALRAELAESTGNPLWGEFEERELRRKLERMTNTLRAMSLGLLGEDLDKIAPSQGRPASKAGG
jgi:hypothetical protein